MAEAHECMQNACMMQLLKWHYHAVPLGIASTAVVNTVVVPHVWFAIVQTDFGCVAVP